MGDEGYGADMGNTIVYTYGNLRLVGSYLSENFVLLAARHFRRGMAKLFFSIHHCFTEEGTLTYLRMLLLLMNTVWSICIAG